MYGGDLVPQNTELSWVVMLLCWIEINKAKLCTGNVIHPRWVLTAGHCVYSNGVEISPHEVFVFVYHAINKYSHYGVQGIFVHPKFLSDGENVYGSTGDIALIKPILPILAGVATLNTNPSYYPDEFCQIAGYGRKGDSEESNPTLHTMMVKALSQAGCSQVSDSTICLLLFRGIGPCIGDSGSPLVCRGRVAGVLSSGRLQGPPVCGATTTNGILFYEPVADYLGWIRAVQEANSKADMTAKSTSGVAILLIALWLLPLNGVLSNLV